MPSGGTKTGPSRPASISISRHSDNQPPREMLKPYVIDEPFFEADEVRKICPICKIRWATGAAMGTRGRRRHFKIISFFHCRNPICIEIANNTAKLRPIRKISAQEIRRNLYTFLLK